MLMGWSGESKSEILETRSRSWESESKILQSRSRIFYLRLRNPAIKCRNFSEFSFQLLQSSFASCLVFPCNKHFIYTQTLTKILFTLLKIWLTNIFLYKNKSQKYEQLYILRTG